MTKISWKSNRDKELQTFLSEVECRARKILRDDNRKRAETGIRSRNTNKSSTNERNCSPPILQNKFDGGKFSSNESRQINESCLSDPKKDSFHKQLESPTILPHYMTQKNSMFTDPVCVFHDPSRKPLSVHQSSQQKSHAYINNRSTKEKKMFYTSKRRLHLERTKTQCKSQGEKDVMITTESGVTIQGRAGERRKNNQFQKLLEERVSLENIRTVTLSREHYRGFVKVKNNSLRLKENLHRLHVLDTKSSMRQKKVIKQQIEPLITSRTHSYVNEKFPSRYLCPDTKQELSTLPHSDFPYETWLLMNNESITNSTNSSKAKIKVSIFRSILHSEGKCQMVIWSLDIYNTFDGNKVNLNISEKIVREMLKMNHYCVLDDQNEKQVLVYMQERFLKKDSDKIRCKCSVRVKRMECTILVQLQVYELDGLDDRNDKFLSSIDMYTHEILSRLKKHLVYNAFEKSFWTSLFNGDIIWSPLLEKIVLTKNDENSMKGWNHHAPTTETPLYTIRFVNNDKHIRLSKRRYPITKESNEYLTSVSLAYRFIQYFLREQCHSTDDISSDTFLAFLQDNKLIEEVSIATQASSSIFSLSARLASENLTYSKTIAPGIMLVGSKSPVESYESIVIEKESNAKSSHKRNEQICCFERKADSMKVLYILAFDNPSSSPATLPLESLIQTSPQLSVFEPQLQIEHEKGICFELRKNIISSKMDSNLPPPTSTIDPEEDKLDWKSYYTGNELFDEHELLSQLAQTKREINKNDSLSFRQVIFAHQLNYRNSTRFHNFGIAEESVTSNLTRVNGKTIGHSNDLYEVKISCLQLSQNLRQIIQNRSMDKDRHCGQSNDPCIFSLKLRTYCVLKVKRQALLLYHICRTEEENSKRLHSKETILRTKIDQTTMIRSGIANEQKKNMSLKGNFYCVFEHYWKSAMVRIAHKALNSCEKVLHSKKDLYLSSCKNVDVREKPLLHNNPNSIITLFGNENGKKEDLHQSASLKIPCLLEDECLTLPQNYSDVNNTKTIHKSSNQKIFHRKDALQKNLHDQWRGLPKPSMGTRISDLFKFRSEECKINILDTAGKTRLVGVIDPVQNVDFKLDESMFQTRTKCFSIRNIKRDIDYATQIMEVKDDQCEKPHNFSGIKVNNLKMSKIIKENHVLVKHVKRKSVKQYQCSIDQLSAVVIAVKHGHYDVLEALFDEGVYVDSSDNNGNTLLILACQQGNKRMIKILLRRGALINSQNLAGNTGLHYLHEYGHESIAEYLLRKGANDKILNADGLTCYEGVHTNQIEDL